MSVVLWGLSIRCHRTVKPTRLFRYTLTLGEKAKNSSKLYLFSVIKAGLIHLTQNKARHAIKKGSR